MKKVLVLLVLIGFSLACGGGGGGSVTDAINSINNGTSGSDSSDISSSTLTGLLKAESWTLTSGKAETSSSDPSKLSIRMYGTSVSDICNNINTPSEVILFSIPNKVGTYPLSFGSDDAQTVTFYDGTTNNIAVSGTVVIESISSANVVGGMNVTANDSNKADGQFVLTFCEDDGGFSINKHQ